MVKHTRPSRYWFNGVVVKDQVADFLKGNEIVQDSVLLLVTIVNNIKAQVHYRCSFPKLIGNRKRMLLAVPLSALMTPIVLCMNVIWR